MEYGRNWRTLPDSGFGQKGKECKGGKKSNRIIVAFLLVQLVSKKTNSYMKI